MKRDARVRRDSGRRWYYESNPAMADTLARVKTIFCDVFNDEELTVSRQTTAKDVEDWDSIMHVSLVVTIEKAFGIRFSSSEVAGLQNVGELVDLIDSKGRG